MSTSGAADCIMAAGSLGGTGLTLTVAVAVVKTAPELGETPLTHSVLPAELTV